MVTVDRAATYPTRAHTVTENTPLIEIPRATAVDRLLGLVPERRRTLAAPPPGSDLKAVVGDAGLPYLGRLFNYLAWGPAEMMGRYRKYGPVSLGLGLGLERVTVAGPDAIDEVVGRRRRDFGQGWDYLIGPFFRRGLLLLEFDEHMFHRRIMQQAFTRPRLEAHLRELAPVVRSTIDRWVPPGPRSSATVSLFPAIKALTLEIAAETFMAVEVGDRRQELTEAFVACTHAGLAVVRYPLPWGRWGAGIRGRKLLEDYFYSMLPDKRRGETADFFSGLCHARTEEGDEFSDADVVNHMIFLIMAAHDTSTTTATAVAYFLGKHPEWQEKVRAEVRDLDRAGGIRTLADLDRLVTLELVLKESLRLIPPVPALSRRAVRDTEILGHFIPAGTMVDCAYQVNHLLPEYWTDPQVFDPERFAEPRREDKSHRLAWVPFGAGAHKCIGMHFGTSEVKTIIAALVRDFRWSFPTDYRMPWSFSSIPSPRDDAPLLLERLG